MITHSKYLPLILSVLILTLTNFSIDAHTPDINSEYRKCVFTDSCGHRMAYRMLTPATVDSVSSYPLVVFLHGSGERGNDNEKQLLHGGSIFTNPANADKYPAFVVFPQCSARSWTADTDPRSFMPGSPDPEESSTEVTLISMIEDILCRFPVDRSRIYIVGLSMGGIATYDLACRYPELFAAAVPICGAVNPDRLAEARDVKFMIFHGDSDEEVPSICSREAYKALKAVGAEVDYIEFSGIGHECWTEAFNYPGFLPWLFTQKKDN